MPNQVRIGVGVVLKGEKDLDKLRDKFDRLTKMGAKGFAIGAGAAVTTQAFNLMGMAVNKIGDVLGDATEAALEEEESISKLGASLRANVPAWDGNTAAIERVLTARMKLGFADDEQRQSLALLVGATHDATKALETQRTAMDLARFKGVDLKTASEALIKVEGGQYRALKALGIVLKDGATASEALAAVQKVAAGQAEAYAATNRGKLEVSQVKVGEAMEKLGAVTMPIVVTVMVGAADAATGLATTLEVLNGKMPATKEGLEATVTGALDLVNAFGFLVPGMDALVRKAKEDLTPAVDKAGGGIANLVRHSGDMSGAFRTAHSVMAGKIVPDLRDIKKDASAAAGAVDDLTTAIYGPQLAVDALTEANLRIKELRKSISESHDKGEIAQFKRDLDSAYEAAFRASFEVAKFNGPSALAEWFKGAQTAAEKAGPGAVAYLKTLRDILDVSGKLPGILGAADIRRIGSGHGTTTYNPPSAKSSPAVPFGGRAEGGPVSADTPYWVGEKGTKELFVPETDGTIVPKSRLGSGGGTTLSLTVNVTPSLGMTPGAARAIGDAVGPSIAAWMQRNGLISRGGSPIRG